jgi:hypothetical protein
VNAPPSSLSFDAVSSHYAPSFDGYTAPPNSGFVIGGPWPGVFDNGFAGVVVDVRLWNFVLPAATIFSNLDTVFPNPTPGLLSYYNFEDATDSVVCDERCFFPFSSSLVRCLLVVCCLLSAFSLLSSWFFYLLYSLCCVLFFLAGVLFV